MEIRIKDRHPPFHEHIITIHILLSGELIIRAVVIVFAETEEQSICNALVRVLMWNDDGGHRRGPLIDRYMVDRYQPTWIAIPLRWLRLTPWNCLESLICQM